MIVGSILKLIDDNTLPNLTGGYIVKLIRLKVKKFLPGNSQIMEDLTHSMLLNTPNPTRYLQNNKTILKIFSEN